jgi:hypothetical protein
LTLVSVEKNLLQELIDLKLKYIKDETDTILTKWQYSSTNQFLNDAEQGIIHEGENDAITLVHLMDQREELLQLKRNLK